MTRGGAPMPGWLVVVPLLAATPAAGGSEASGAPPAESPEASDEPLAAHRDGPDPNRLEIGVLPALAYDTNTGFGFGVVGTLAKFAEEADPYAWRLEALFYMTVLDAPGG